MYMALKSYDKSLREKKALRNREKTLKKRLKKYSKSGKI